MQYTVDGGKHWHNVTPKSVPDHGAVETVAPSTIHDGTVYVSIDRHLLGDYKPYLLVLERFRKDLDANRNAHAERRMVRAFGSSGHA